MAEITIKQAFEISKSNNEIRADEDAAVFQAGSAAALKAAAMWLEKKAIWNDQKDMIVKITANEKQLLAQGHLPEEKPCL